MLCLISLDSIELAFVRVNVQLLLVLGHPDAVDATLAIELTYAHLLLYVKESNFVEHPNHDHRPEFHRRNVLPYPVFFKCSWGHVLQFIDVEGLKLNLYPVMEVPLLIIQSVERVVYEHVCDRAGVYLGQGLVQFHRFQINDLDALVRRIVNECDVIFLMDGKIL